jgi:hypothetical protein
MREVIDIEKEDVEKPQQAEVITIANEEKQEPKTNVVAIKEEAKENTITLEDGRFKFSSFNSILKWAKVISDSNLVPSDYKNKPTDIALCVGMGLEKGLSPFQSLLSISVIKGRPCLWGNAQIALAQQTGELEEYKIEFSGERKTDNWECKATLKRKGIEWTNTYGWIDAKEGGLLGKDNWTKSAKAMMENRASSAVLRRAFADVFCGIYTVEEMEDVTPSNDKQQKTQGLEEVNKMKIGS